ncbi:MAG: response regulator transcription factor [Terracidiphilus sp.]|jgi:DNA-binding NarL/FixJ family response regulator
MSEAGQIRILVVDDHPIVRAGLESILNSQPDMQVIGYADSGDLAVDKACELNPDIVLMDLRLPGMSGVDAIRLIRESRSEAKILVLTTYDGDEDIHQALQAGAASYIVKGMPYETLLRAIRRIYAGKSFLPREVSHLLDGHSPDELSVKERRVLTLMAEGRSNRAIAKQLGITERTVKFHVGNILACLGVDDRTQAVVVALRRGYVHLEQHPDEPPRHERD